MNKKILVVDDEPAIGRMVKMSLSYEGYDARTAINGFEAMESVVDWKPYLLVLDIMMPGMDGYEVCAEIKNKPETKNIKVIFLTARGSSGDERKGFAVGGDDFIVKPFDPEVLIEKIKELIGPAVIKG
ncbi:response regulator [bacterium]|nr:response regulator [bacterium]